MSSSHTPVDGQTRGQPAPLSRSQMLAKIRKRRHTILKKIDEFHGFSSADIYLLVHVNGKFYRYVASQNPLWPPTQVQVEKSYPLPQLYTPASFKVSKRESVANSKGRVKQEGGVRNKQHV
ncbi:hypothetical protein GE09DRAFT_1149318 [Coniochaeta sp. 2T2.1]|nr:hypothetical protein GE09DRAFT_1149318 [Coniochaeta sp. 2T2.1]